MTVLAIPLDPHVRGCCRTLPLAPPVKAVCMAEAVGVERYVLGTVASYPPPTVSGRV